MKYCIVMPRLTEIEEQAYDEENAKCQDSVAYHKLLVAVNALVFHTFFS